MWINLSEDEFVRIAAFVALLTDEKKPDEVALLKKLVASAIETKIPANAAWVDKAKELYVFGTDGDREIDSEAVVSPSDDGAYVMMWGWVRNDQMGIEDEDDEGLCRTCGEEYTQGGDDFDGECPDCADLTDQKLHPENYE